MEELDEMDTPIEGMEGMEGELKKRTRRAFNNAWQKRYFSTNNYYLKYRDVGKEVVTWSGAIDLKTVTRID